MIRHLAGLAEVVEDVKAAAAFYESLGLVVKIDEDANYGHVEIDGVMHFGLWPREAAAQAIFGSADKASQVPLGFTLGFEVDSVDEDGKRLSNVVQDPKDEPWGQRVMRFTSPSGTICELSETSWARHLTSNVAAQL